MTMKAHSEPPERVEELIDRLNRAGDTWEGVVSQGEIAQPGDEKRRDAVWLTNALGECFPRGCVVRTEDGTWHEANGDHVEPFL